MRRGYWVADIAPAYGAPEVITADHQRRQASFNDYIRIAKLVQTTDLLHLNGGILVQPGELEADMASLVMVYTALTPGDKPLLGIQGTEPKVRRIMELGCIAFGGEAEFKSCSRFLFLVNTLSPLQIAEKYILPNRGISAVTDAGQVGAQSGYEAMMTLSSDYQYRTSLVVHGAGILNSFSQFSFEQFMVDLEIIRRAGPGDVRNPSAYPYPIQKEVRDRLDHVVGGAKDDGQCPEFDNLWTEELRPEIPQADYHRDYYSHV